MRGHGSRWRQVLGTVAVLALVTAPTTALAQQPKFPESLPVPKSPVAPTPAAGAPSPAAPAAPAPAPTGAPSGPRDPFEPLVKKAGSADEKRIQEISGLKLAGVIWDPVNREQIRALVETPDGLGYYLRVNEDKFGGTVVAIERDRVRFSVREQVPGGASRLRTIELRLAKPDGQ